MIAAVIPSVANEYPPQSHPAAHASHSAWEDALLAEQVKSRLHNRPYLSVRELRCACCAGVVTIWGRVPTYHALQVALSVISELAGVSRVRDLVQVAFSGDCTVGKRDS